MGKNYKEQASYDLLHNDKEIDGKLKRSVVRRWYRHNFHLGWYRKYRNVLKEKIFNMLNKKEE